MARALLFTATCIAAVLPSVSGSATLIPKFSSAGCTGHLSDLSVISITCDLSDEGFSDEGCTYGSNVFITGQVTTDADLPRPLKISAQQTFPSLYSVGSTVYNAEVEDICATGTVTAYPDSNDDYDYCPQAGVYRFHFMYENFGSHQSWYAGWYGYSFGMNVHLKHEGGGSDYGSCHINVRASHGKDDSYATSATFVSVATLGLAGICVGLYKRRRKERLVCQDENERTKELATNFELVQDSATSFV